MAPSGAIVFSTDGTYAVTGAAGEDEDLFEFTPTTLGTTTSGIFSPLLDLTALGIHYSEDIGAIEMIWTP